MQSQHSQSYRSVVKEKDREREMEREREKERERGRKRGEKRGIASLPGSLSLLSSARTHRHHEWNGRGLLFA